MLQAPNFNFDQQRLIDSCLRQYCSTPKCVVVQQRVSPFRSQFFDISPSDATFYIPLPKSHTFYGSTPTHMSMLGFDLSGYHETVAGRIVNLLLVIFGSSVCCAFIYYRCATVRAWRRVPYIIWRKPHPVPLYMARQYDSESRVLLSPASCSVRWNYLLTQTFAPNLVVIAIYADSLLFMLGSSLTQFTLDANDNVRVCRATILLCITAYLSSKLLIYLFLVDRAHIVRGTTKGRLKSKLYLFHLGFILGKFDPASTHCDISNFVFLVLLLAFHANDITSDGLCVIAVNHDILICICVVDVIINVGTIAFPSKRSKADLGSLPTIVLFSAIVIQCITSNEHSASAMSGTPAGRGSGGSWDSSNYYHPSTSRRTGSSTLCERGGGGGGGGGSGGGAPGDGSGQGSQDMVLGPIQTVPAPTLAKDEGGGP
ncbi:uncharacterized protein PG986_010573 [Apiospora aurea]|uniref:Transmembrane protein n=1 Tax=Apiospora aurea TaxID=335848 RepID=A0ABR1Q2T9_9PEZI